MELINDVHKFINVAKAHKPTGLFHFPSRICKNEKDYSSTKTLHSHMFQRGFMLNYICWTRHGERGVMLEDEEEEEYNILNFAQYGASEDTTMGELEEDAEVEVVEYDLG
jgi:hypothetical protein